VRADVRNKLLAVVFTSFLMMVTGVTLRLHLAHFKQPARHDSEHCSICQLLLKAPNKFTVDLDPPVRAEYLIQLIAEVCPVAYVPTCGPDPILPRGPPFCS